MVLEDARKYGIAWRPLGDAISKEKGLFYEPFFFCLVLQVDESNPYKYDDVQDAQVSRRPGKAESDVSHGSIEANLAGRHDANFPWGTPY